MTSERYYTVPLAILRDGTSALHVLESAVSYGITSAGIAFQVHHADDQEKLDALRDDANKRAHEAGMPWLPPAKLKLADADGRTLSRVEAERLWVAAHLGATLLGITGGIRERNAANYARLQREGQVFFRIKSEWLWGALNQARHEAGRCEAPERPISWREFRIIAAVLSGKVNSHGFSFLGWESIQARACGFHSKPLFQSGLASLPAHCEPLTRQMIRAATDKLEALGFFARCRYSRGKAGGLMAYSFRHPKRENLQAAVQQWDAANRAFKTKTASHRASDQEAFKRTNQEPT